MKRRHWTIWFTVKGFNGTKLGQACALSVILLLIITAITVIQMRMSNRADDWR